MDQNICFKNIYFNHALISESIALKPLAAKVLLLLPLRQWAAGQMQHRGQQMAQSEKPDFTSFRTTSPLFILLPLRQRALVQAVARAGASQQTARPCGTPRRRRRGSSIKRGEVVLKDVKSGFSLYAICWPRCCICPAACQRSGRRRSTSAAIGLSAIDSLLSARFKYIFLKQIFCTIFSCYTY